MSAQSSFITAAGALGTLNTITFEDQPVGFNANFSAAPGVTVALNTPNFGAGFSGISNTTVGNLYGFNTTSGGSRWLGFTMGSATFHFADPTHSFGMYMTGLQTVLTTALTVNFTDQQSEVLTSPVNTNGGAQYFGFTDPGASISSITITDLSNDAWGIDDVTYNDSPVDPVPEPGTLMLLGAGFLGLAVFGKRSKTRN